MRQSLGKGIKECVHGDGEELLELFHSHGPSCLFCCMWAPILMYWDLNSVSFSIWISKTFQTFQQKSSLISQNSLSYSLQNHACCQRIFSFGVIHVFLIYSKRLHLLILKNRFSNSVCNKGWPGGEFPFN